MNEAAGLRADPTAPARRVRALATKATPQVYQLDFKRLAPEEV
jgi:hypothetical protein